jgi:hypothetical protein
MAGYSGTPLAKKLGIKEGARLALVDAPDGFRALLAAPESGMPDAVVMAKGLAGGAPLDVIVFFAKRRAELARRLASLRARMAPAAGLWIAWPKKNRKGSSQQAAEVLTDMTEDVVRAVALPTGLVDNKVCAIDDTWSGLRLVIRVSERHPA